MQPKPGSEFAPAKINLYLHVTGRRGDGYHLLDSLVAFADVGDRVEVAQARELSLALDGPCADGLQVEGNSVFKAAEALRRRAGTRQGAALRLHKYLPVASGIGGGSADAAAALRLLARFWGLGLTERALSETALALGADVPACLRSCALYMEGIGEKLSPGPPLKGLHLLLANPGKPLKTPDVFAGVLPPFSIAPAHPRSFDSPLRCVEFLRGCRNDLEAPALALLPEIREVLDMLALQEGCHLARMSGSGATCFGVFTAREAASVAAAHIQKQQPGWWVKEASVQ